MHSSILLSFTVSSPLGLGSDSDSDSHSYYNSDSSFLSPLEREVDYRSVSWTKKQAVAVESDLDSDPDCHNSDSSLLLLLLFSSAVEAKPNSSSADTSPDHHTDLYTHPHHHLLSLLASLPAEVPRPHQVYTHDRCS